MRTKTKEDLINKKSNLIMANGVSILLFLFINILVTSVLFIFKIEITKINFIVSSGIWAIITLIIFNKNYKKKYFSIINLILISLAMLLAINVAGKIIDLTWDGNSYHKVAIGNMADGWNPVYQSIETFNNNNNNIKLNSVSSTWTDHYAKGTWIYSANLYSFFENIEVGKSFLMLLGASAFLIALGLFAKKATGIISLILSTIIILNPVFIVQLATNYNDAILYILTTILLLTLVFITLNNSDKENIKLFYIYSIVIVLLINIKFTGFVFAGIYSLFFYLYLIIKKDRDYVKIKLFTLFGFISLIIGFFVVGLSTYPKNLLYSPHIFHPLFGEEKVDIMTANQPYSFENENGFVKFIRGNFSECENIGRASMIEPKLKIPFTVSDKEITELYASDLRIGGYGPLFGGLIIISLLVFISGARTVYKRNIPNFQVITICLLSTFTIGVLLEGSWWARYFPQFYLIAMVTIIVLSHLKNKKIAKGLILLYCSILAFNTFLVTRSHYMYEKKVQQIEVSNLNRVELFVNEYGKENLYLYSKGFDGLFYNVRDKIGKVNILTEPSDNYREIHSLNSMVSIYIKEK